MHTILNWVTVIVKFMPHVAQVEEQVAEKHITIFLTSKRHLNDLKLYLDMKFSI